MGQECLGWGAHPRQEPCKGSVGPSGQEGAGAEQVPQALREDGARRPRLTVRVAKRHVGQGLPQAGRGLCSAVKSDMYDCKPHACV